MIWQEYFKLPFEYQDFFIFDSTGRSVANFTEFSKFKNHIKFRDENKVKLLDSINGDYILKQSEPIVFSFDSNEVLILLNNRPIIQLRGWGYLTGQGGCKLDSEKAIEIQISLGNWIIDKLNRKS